MYTFGQVSASSSRPWSSLQFQTFSGILISGLLGCHLSTFQPTGRPTSKLTNAHKFCSHYLFWFSTCCIGAMSSGTPRNSQGWEIHLHGTDQLLHILKHQILFVHLVAHSDGLVKLRFLQKKKSDSGSIDCLWRFLDRNLFVVIVFRSPILPLPHKQ